MHQDLGLIELMSVGENMAMGYGYPRRWQWLIDWTAVDAKARDVLADLDSPLPLDVAGIGAQPRREVDRRDRPRAVSRKAELLVLDEPTASLPEADVGRLFAILERLARATSASSMSPTGSTRCFASPMR